MAHNNKKQWYILLFKSDEKNKLDIVWHTQQAGVDATTYDIHF